MCVCVCVCVCVERWGGSVDCYIIDHANEEGNRH